VVAPTTPLYEPAGHEEHDVAMTPPPYVPAAHAMQEEPER
jgi:hypothetical protein